MAFTWPAVRCHQVRIRPNDDCLAWLLYRADWIAVNEPPMIAGWDIYFENKWDQYCWSGLDLEVDTLGLLKTIVIQVDGVTLNDPATGLGFFPVQTDGRKVVHLTLPWGRGHVFHFVATDANPGQLFEHRWFLVDEPSEQHNWNQPFTILGSRADKWLKAVVFECDTFGQDKSVTIEADGVVVETLVVNTNGRKVVQLALPTGEKLGRVWRFFPVDHQPSRLLLAPADFRRGAVRARAGRRRKSTTTKRGSGHRLRRGQHHDQGRRPTCCSPSRRISTSTGPPRWSTPTSSRRRTT